MDRPKATSHQETPNQKLPMFQEGISTEMEVISGVPIFYVDVEHKDEAIAEIIDSFGEQTVLRIINSHFVKDAIEHGTDRVHIDEHDFRSIIHYITGHGYGHDLWGVEATAIEMGLTAADVFCGTPLEDFKHQREEGYSSTGLGIPDDRSAILIFDGNKVRHIEDTDGYLFTNPQEKKQALLGVIKFREQLFEFEAVLNTAESIDEKIKVIENEISQDMNTTDGLRKAFYIALNIVTLLRNESVKNVSNPSSDSTKRIKKLKDAVESLKDETGIITTVLDFKMAIDSVRKWLAKQKAQSAQPETEKSFFEKLRAKSMPKRPDQIIQTLRSELGKPALPKKYKDQLQEVLEDAQKCKQELETEATNSVVDLQHKTRNSLEDHL